MSEINNEKVKIWTKNRGCSTKLKIIAQSGSRIHHDRPYSYEGDTDHEHDTACSEKRRSKVFEELKKKDTSFVPTHG